MFKYYKNLILRTKPVESIIIHLVIMAVAFSSLFVSLVFTPERLEKNDGLAVLLPRCVFKRITGRPCPTCGMGRAFSSISRCEFRRAFDYNKLSFIIYPVFVLAAAASPLSLAYSIYLSRDGRKK